LPNRSANFSGSALGYQGSLILPREVFIATTRNVTSSLSLVEQRASWWSTAQTDGKHTIYTLGVRPAYEVGNLRKGAKYRPFPVRQNEVDENERFKITDANSSAYELRTSITFGGNTSAGLVLRASQTSGEETVITYDPTREELTITRNKSSLLTFSPDAPANSASYIASYQEMGKLRLWEIDEKRQALNLIIYGMANNFRQRWT
jgi:hypothetical protein